ncbi:unnamed protein product [Rotaria sordida]|uniref:Ubiquinol-cytochrome c chaperone domain-containing protein n=2 Tax=Rotaria sordida TaxID=392033 RepID=A0A818SB81_9BILA|nr:unnamed protein product [Rotaria sordida]
MHTSLEKQLIEKETIVSIKTSEINTIEECYQQYLEEAKMILRHTDSRSANVIINQELQFLRKKCQEKDRKLKDLQMLRFTFYKQLNYIRCSHVIFQRFLSAQPSPKANQTTARPVGTGLSTVQTSSNLPVLYEPSLISRIKMKFGLQAELREPQKVLYQAAAISYYMIASSVDFDGIQRELDMPDVFASFGRIIFLHIWFLLVRYIQLGPTGIFLRRQLARTMWTDLDLRAQQILPGQGKVRRSQLEELRAEMNAFMIALDEGLVDDDTVLAAAIWRHFRHFQPTRLESLVTLVKYIRKNIQHLEQLPDENFIKNGYIYFLPLYSDIVDTKFVNQHYLDFKNKAGGLVRK